MIHTKLLNSMKDFEALKAGDVVIVEWHRDSYKDGKRTRFASYVVHENMHHSPDYDGKGPSEIILQTRMNVYFNYALFLGIVEGASNLKSCVLVTSDGLP